MGGVTSKVFKATCDTAAHFGEGIKQVRDLITQVGISIKDVAVGSAKAVGNTVEATARLTAGVASGAVGYAYTGMGKLANYADNPDYGRALELRGAKLKNYASRQCQGSYEAAKHTGLRAYDTLKASTKVVAGSITTCLAGAETALLVVTSAGIAGIEGTMMIGGAIFGGTTTPSETNGQPGAGGAFGDEPGSAPRNANEMARLLEQQQEQNSELKLCLKASQDENKVLRDENAELRRERAPANDL